MSAALVALAYGLHWGGWYVVGLLCLGIAFAAAVLTLSLEHDRAFSASILYVGLGVVAAVAMAVVGITPLDLERDHDLMLRLAELALVVSVFGAGLTIEREVRRRSWMSVTVLLVLVMPLTIGAIAAFGVWAMGLPFAAALLLGAVLAPTDPVLAGDVGLSAPGGPTYGEPRLSLHTEAGLNDGLASPFVVLGLAVATHHGAGWLGTWVAADLLYATGAALALGLILGTAAAAALAGARHRRLLAPELDSFAAIAIVLIIYGITESVGAYGLVAVFVAGFAFRRYEFEHERNAAVHRGLETSGTVLELLVLLLLGSMLTIDGLGAPGVPGWVLAPVLLLVIRPALVFATSGRGFLTRRETAFLAFFGVRGVAALYYAAVVAGSHALPPHDRHVVVWTTVAVVVTSILVHGVTATPLTNRLLTTSASPSAGRSRQ